MEALNHPWLLGVDEDEQDGGVVLVGSVGRVGSMGSVGSFESLDAASLVGAPNPAKLFGPSSQPLGDTLVQRLQRYGGYSKLKKVCAKRGEGTDAGDGWEGRGGAAAAALWRLLITEEGERCKGWRTGSGWGQRDVLGVSSSATAAIQS